jgi:hypothetical protein
MLLAGCGSNPALVGMPQMRATGAYQTASVVHVVPMSEVGKLPLTVTRLTRTAGTGKNADDRAFEITGKDANGPVNLTISWHKRVPNTFDGDYFTAVRNFEGIATEAEMQATLTQLAKAKLPANVTPAVLDELNAVVKAHFFAMTGDDTDPADATTFEPLTNVKPDFGFKDADPKVEAALRVVGRRDGKPFEVILESRKQRVDGQPQIGHDMIRIKVNGQVVTSAEQVRQEYTALRFASFVSDKARQDTGVSLGWFRAVFGGGWTLVTTPDFPQ